MIVGVGTIEKNNKDWKGEHNVMDMQILPQAQIDKMKKIMDDLFKHTTGKSVADFKAQYRLTSEEYNMIYDLTMPLIRDANAKRYWYMKFLGFKLGIESITEFTSLKTLGRNILKVKPKEIKKMTMTELEYFEKDVKEYLSTVERFQKMLTDLLKKSDGEDLMVEATGYLVHKPEWKDYELHKPTEEGLYLTAINLTPNSKESTWLYEVLTYSQHLDQVDDYDFMNEHHGGFYAYNEATETFYEVEVDKWMPLFKVED